jgi:hypothetical protein
VSGKPDSGAYLPGVCVVILARQRPSSQDRTLILSVSIDLVGDRRNTCDGWGMSFAGAGSVLGFNVICQGVNRPG